MDAVEHPFGKRIGGRLCLDFVNTVRGRVTRSGARRVKDYADRIVGERLDSYDALLRWATLVGVVTQREAKSLSQHASMKPSDAAAVLQRSLALREAVYRVFKAAVEERSPPAEELAVLNRELQVARMHERLVGSPRLAWEWDGTLALDRVLWSVVRSAAELLTSANLERVRQCPGHECGWLFLDTSRAGRRQWCDMADCGNLAKVRRFRSKQRGRRMSARS